MKTNTILTLLLPLALTAMLGSCSFLDIDTENKIATSAVDYTKTSEMYQPVIGSRSNSKNKYSGFKKLMSFTIYSFTVCSVGIFVSLTKSYAVVKALSFSSGMASYLANLTKSASWSILLSFA